MVVAVVVRVVCIKFYYNFTEGFSLFWWKFFGISVAVLPTYTYGIQYECIYRCVHIDQRTKCQLSVSGDKCEWIVNQNKTKKNSNLVLGIIKWNSFSKLCNDIFYVRRNKSILKSELPIKLGAFKSKNRKSFFVCFWTKSSFLLFHSKLSMNCVHFWLIPTKNTHIERERESNQPIALPHNYIWTMHLCVCACAHYVLVAVGSICWKV